MEHILRALWSDESGQDLVEYVLIVVLIALAAVLAMTQLGGDINNAFNEASSQLNANIS